MSVSFLYGSSSNDDQARQGKATHMRCLNAVQEAAITDGLDAPSLDISNE